MLVWRALRGLTDTSSSLSHRVSELSGVVVLNKNGASGWPTDDEKFTELSNIRAHQDSRAPRSDLMFLKSFDQKKITTRIVC